MHEIKGRHMHVGMISYGRGREGGREGPGPIVGMSDFCMYSTSTRANMPTLANNNNNNTNLGVGCMERRSLRNTSPSLE
jgi:hypothetical protein